NRHVELLMERTRVSKLWIDGNYIGSCDTLNGKHRYNVGPYIDKGTHKITIMIDNSTYPVKGGHMTSPDTQTNWNGITGDIKLIIYGERYLNDVTIYSDIHNKSVTVKAKLMGGKDGFLKTWVTDGSSDMKEQTYEFQGNEIEFIYCLDDTVKLWSEQDPQLYTLFIEYMEDSSSKAYVERSEHSFGLREFKAKDNMFAINGNITFLRGKHDGLIFPMTGYAPTDVESWLKVLGAAKEYGINHYRFHTCCPPEAAFIVADQLGIYMEPELPFWGTVTGEGEVGHDPEALKYLINEGYRMLDEFGNHPSFVMMSLGNELWGNKEVLNNILKGYKEYDPRHLYTQGSNNFQFSPCILDEDDFFCGVRFSRDRLFRGSYAMCDAPQGHIQVEKPNTIHNYDEMIRPKNKALNNINDGGYIEIQYGTGVAKVEQLEVEELYPEIPVVSHEVGQYDTFPNFQEIDKYKGVLKPENLNVFKERLARKGLIHKAEGFFKASGSLAVDCYKNEIETALRSKELAGFQLLDLQDFSGQGTALVGILDAFMESKGLITASEWRGFCSDLVLLAEFPDYTCKAGQVFSTNIKMANYRSGEILTASVLKVDILCAGVSIYSKSINITNVHLGLNDLCQLDIRLPETEKPQRLEFVISLEGTDIHNKYILWSYPDCPKVESHDELMIETDMGRAVEALKVGKNVLLLLQQSDNLDSIEGTYCTDFWCYPMFRSISENIGKPVPIGTLGLMVNNNHPALKEFPSDFYSTPQWWDIVENSRSTILDGSKIEPIVSTIDNFERNHNLGLIYEAKVYNGNLLVCTSELNNMGNNIIAKWLLYSLTSYGRSEEFKANVKLNIDHK
ncbi:MAG TPA: beta-glucuronidase, partial [Clostridiales bacterium]|nr:beta-glucuronidase [Clostridiales bacterium]